MKKVYLETPEAVINALKEGKEVKSDTDFTYTMVDGCIVSKKDKWVYVGDNICMNDKPYILEEKPFEIEIGKVYETRIGNKATVVKEFMCLYAVLIEQFNEVKAILVHKNGKVYLNKNNNLDIIGPWKEEYENE